MTSETIAMSWSAVESVNASMHRAADESHWLDVLDLATKRHTMLQAHFDRFPIGPDNAEFYRRHMDLMLQGETKLRDAVRNARKALMSEGIDTQRKQRALGAYLNVAMR